LGNLAGKSIGPNVLQKVMAGDQVSAITDYYYQSATGGSNPNMVSMLLGSLSQAITGGSAASGLVKSGASGISSQLNATPAFTSAVSPASAGTTPQAYLTILFFDERFNFISAADGGVVQSQVAASVTGSGAQLSQLNIKAPKNGYVYAYVSNQSDQDVYFDNFKVTVQTGNIIEENHYYAFGLKIAAISSRKLPDANEGNVKNNYQYQGAYNEFDDDIALNDFPLRNYDPQIGRWIQQDPYQQFASPYVGMGNDPANLIDPTGGIGIPCPGTSQLAIFFMKAGEAIGKGLDALGRLSPFLSAGLNAARIGADVYNRSVQFQIIDKQLVGNLTLQVGISSENDQQPSYWILYNGTEVNIYEGEFGDMYKLKYSFKGTSGIITFNDPSMQEQANDYRNSKFQFTQVEVREGGEQQKIFVGPLPEGNYSIDLSLDPERQGNVASNGKTTPGQGMEKLTYFKNGKEYVKSPDWGSRRARLNADPNTNLGGRDGNFYFHNSHKGYTHGCIETEPGLFKELMIIRRTQTKIRVKIKYRSKNATTNGKTGN
jgi:RHS repeat-associated protein